MTTFLYTALVVFITGIYFLLSTSVFAEFTHEQEEQMNQEAFKDKI
ncbi:hypothetical protein [Nitrosomonas sp. Nm166]|nr:hypothetical protein [Nitrosomonas sp. Nm166]SFE40040.1 hypothetical protein SAMN05428977_101522 [Nitrosomonas sp. Nm166]